MVPESPDHTGFSFALHGVSWPLVTFHGVAAGDTLILTSLLYGRFSGDLQIFL
jgi:hypothetical protein